MLVTYERADTTLKTVEVNEELADRLADLLLSGATVRVDTAKTYRTRNFIIPITDGYIDMPRGDEYYN